MSYLLALAMLAVFFASYAIVTNGGLRWVRQVMARPSPPVMFGAIYGCSIVGAALGESVADGMHWVGAGSYLIIGIGATIGAGGVVGFWRYSRRALG